ncbi:hypothetical protein EON83_00005 [bacterium]|nr:MAG: hypothetical protein EON83_00005 [bacterium]
MADVSLVVPAPGHFSTYPGFGAWEIKDYDVTPTATTSNNPLNPWVNFTGGGTSAPGGAFERGFPTPTNSGPVATGTITYSNYFNISQACATITFDSSLLGKYLQYYESNGPAPSFAPNICVSVPPSLYSIYVGRTPGVTNNFTFRVLAQGGSQLATPPNGGRYVSPVSLQIDIAGSITTHAGVSGFYNTARDGLTGSFNGWECLGTRDIAPDYNTTYSADRSIRVRVIDAVGRYSVWVSLRSQPNSTITGEWDANGEYVEVDLTQSWDLNGVVTTRTFGTSGGTGPAPAYELMTATKLRISEAAIAARGTNTSAAFQLTQTTTDNETLTIQGASITIPAYARLARRLWQAGGNARAVWQCAPLDAATTRLSRFDASVTPPAPVAIRSFGKVSIPATAPTPGRRPLKGAKTAGKGYGSIYVANFETDNTIALYNGVDLATSGATWTRLATMWTTTPHSFHFVLLPAGGAATLAVRTVSGVRGLWFKRTTNPATWPADTAAVLVSTAITVSDEFEIRVIGGMVEAWNAAGAKFRALSGGLTSTDWIAA